MDIYFITGEAGAIESYKWIDGEKESVSVIEESSLIKTTIDEEYYEFKNGLYSMSKVRR